VELGACRPSTGAQLRPARTGWERRACKRRSDGAAFALAGDARSSRHAHTDDSSAKGEPRAETGRAQRERGTVDLPRSTPARCAVMVKLLDIPLRP
jgi:hypothetical protein